MTTAAAELSQAELTAAYDYLMAAAAANRRVLPPSRVVRLSGAPTNACRQLASRAGAVTAEARGADCVFVEFAALQDALRLVAEADYSGDVCGADGDVLHVAFARYVRLPRSGEAAAASGASAATSSSPDSVSGGSSIGGKRGSKRK